MILQFRVGLLPLIAFLKKSKMEQSEEEEDYEFPQQCQEVGGTKYCLATSDESRSPIGPTRRGLAKTTKQSEFSP